MEDNKLKSAVRFLQFLVLKSKQVPLQTAHFQNSVTNVADVNLQMESVEEEGEEVTEIKTSTI
jgi:hypothetical protein